MDRALALEQFESRQRAQSRQLGVLAALSEDRALLESWSEGGPASSVAGLGYFDQTGEPTASVTRLLERLRTRYGPDFLAHRTAALREALSQAARADPTAWRVDPPRGIYHEPPFQLSFARRYHSVATSLAALQLLERQSGLREDATIRPVGPSWWLEPAERSRLEGFARELEDQLVRLVGSSRSDWGRPFLVGLARMLAVEQSLAANRFVFLDSLPDDARSLDREFSGRRLDVLGRIIRTGHEEAEAARLAWAQAKAIAERDWARLEGAANRVYELESAVRESRELRVARGRWIPSRSAPATESVQPAREPARQDLQRRIRAVAAREADYRRALDELYRYGLISRNCVSEIFRTLNDSEASLGGSIDGHSDGTFVPFLSATAVDREYRVTARRTLPSWRELELAEMRRHENPVLVALRESNTLTARSYQRGQEDSWFLFFTDDALLLRPLFGAFNLVAGVGESMWGLAVLPFDRGATLTSGVRGSLSSLPELVFWNIRKGSNDWVPARNHEPED